MKQDIRSIFLSEDKLRRAEVFEKTGVWYVNMIVGDQIVECRAMVSDDGTVHSERYAEDCAENWIIGVIQ
jgi:hypothetical protein